MPGPCRLSFSALLLPKQLILRKRIALLSECLGRTQLDCSAFYRPPSCEGFPDSVLSELMAITHLCPLQSPPHVTSAPQVRLASAAPPVLCCCRHFCSMTLALRAGGTATTLGFYKYVYLKISLARRLTFLIFEHLMHGFLFSSGIKTCQKLRSV